MKEQDEQQQHEQTRDAPGAEAAAAEVRDQGPRRDHDGPEIGEPRTADPQAADPEIGDNLARPDPAELHMLLEDARARADQDRDQLLRVRAEMENMQRRQAKELENAHKFALDNFVKELLLVRDSLELGYAAATEPDADVAKLREGTELTLKQLGDVMSKFGVERVHPEGEAFNPEFHQAMSVQPRADVPPNTVTAVIQSGYLLNGRLMRPALVMVSKQE
jgi:molecular chaperone GrpE